MAAEVTKIIDPDNAGGTDYLSLNAWEAALGGTTTGHLINDDQIAIAQCRNSSGSADTTVVNIDGWTTDATRYIQVESYTGYRHVGQWDETKYYLHNNDTAGDTLFIREDFVRIDGIQIKVTETSTNSRNGIQLNVLGGATTDIRLTNLIIKGICSGTGAGVGIAVFDADAEVMIWNCLIYDFISGADAGFRGIEGSTFTSLKIWHCTVHNCYFGIYESGTVSIDEVKNTIVFDTADDFQGTFAVIDYCASDDNDGTNNVDETAGGKTWADAFNNYGADDFSLKAASLMIGASGGDPSGGLITTDIAGNARSATWDVGTFEYVAAGGPTGLSGSLVRQFTGARSLEGTLDSSGGFVRKFTGLRAVTGVLNFTGTVVAAIGLIKRAIAGALSFTGTSVRKFTGARSVSGTLDSSGSLIRKFTGLRSLVGSLSFSGTVTGIVGLISRAVSGVISFSGGVVRKLYSSRPIDGTLSFTGTTMRKFTGMRTITGTLNLTGLLIRKFTGSRVIAGTLSFLGSVIADTVEWIASLLRTMFISQENRTTTIPPENRTTTIAPENRTITIGG